MLTEPLRVLDDFVGVWVMERRITQSDGSQARLNGQARWTPHEGGLSYAESGYLEMPGQKPVLAERRYHWDAALNVYFDDRRLFHQVPASGGSVSHWCDPDTYEGLYDFGAWPSFEVSWVVSGPRKDYHMHTIYHSQRP